MACAAARADLGLARKAMHSLPPLAACVRIDERGLAIAQPKAPADLAGALVRADMSERTHERPNDAAAATGQPRGAQPYIRT